ncbi:T9SS type B sorting domain-containing protein [Pedobacter rhizosphaerae]|uniref:Conserved repeat domain-containing protein/gliding motility-associated C-terminal domain-containing protein n=1 Tax=Pedobacter rhizosphaerae TaxID=390241 RepID=A0A1H9VB86_9SPHI|nr:gliding motility-associated C-terminal domain-containing protein [Pedobacter rhizosphaerae]SES18935.1 conserved repeat domain-containing protein/gliding motility-associated C-terminal domain-containing protein [Pedobacter rhizosphaerae]
MRIRILIFWFLVLLLLGRQTGYSQNAPVGRQTVTIREGSSAVLHANSAGASSYIWFKDGVLINGQKGNSIITATAGIYKVASINAQGCTSDLSEEIVVAILPLPSADISITKTSEKREVISNQVFDYHLLVRNNGKDDASGLTIKDNLPENLIFEKLSNPTEGNAYYDPIERTVKWDILQLPNGAFAELIISVRSKQHGLVSNAASVSANEADPNLTNNTSIDHKEIFGLKIPNVFTPNGDGKNDNFYLEHLEAFELNEVTVMNRWGSTVYQAQGYANDWNALGLSDGTYFYVVKVKNGKSDWMSYKGYVTVIR